MPPLFIEISIFSGWILHPVNWTNDKYFVNGYGVTDRKIQNEEDNKEAYPYGMDHGVREGCNTW